jgi:hypothetical protein
MVVYTGIDPVTEPSPDVDSRPALADVVRDDEVCG